jgi:aminoglycoside 6'-N-acetyltransferase I
MHELWPQHTLQSIKHEANSIRQAPNKTAFVVSYDAKRVAFINVSIRRDYVPGASQEKVGYIEGIYVKTNWRHRGIAKKMVEHATNWFLVNGCSEIGSDTEVDNVVSLGWHETMGFKKVRVLAHYIKDIADKQ